MPIETREDRTFLAKLADDPQFTEDVDSLMTESYGHPPKVVLDLSQVRYVNSSNIAKLLRLRKLIIEKNGKLVLVGPSPQVWSVFTVTGLDKVFLFMPDVASALAAEKGRGKGKGA